MMLSIERFEGEYALCEDDNGEQVKLKRALLPRLAAEGDIIKADKGGAYHIDRERTGQRRRQNSDRLSRMGALSRRGAITDILSKASQPVSASALAEKFRVSRQIVVGDIALLRASGAPIVATPRGYLLENTPEFSAFDHTIACRHGSDEKLVEELYTIVDNGATVIDVIVEHPVYGQIVGQLHISSRFDVDRFYEALKSSEASPLSQLTGGIHLHTIRCGSAECLERVKKGLAAAGILVSE